MSDTAPALADALDIPIDPPVSVKGVEYAQATLREPTLAQVRDAHAKLDDAVMPSVGAQREYELTFFAAVSRLPRPVVDALPVRAIRWGVDYLTAFVTAPLPDAPADVEDQFTLALDPPVRANGGEIGEVELREPRGGELRAAEALMGPQTPPLPGAVRKYQIRLIQEVSGLNALAVGQLPIRAAREAVRYLENFERSVPATGKSLASA